MFGNDVRIKRTETLTYLGIVIEIRESRRYNDKKKGVCVMKPLTCEMCGGTDVVKQDGLFVCQYCGTKYSVEEARKMMIEGTVEIQGTVQVDNTAQLQTSLLNARRAREVGNWDGVEKHYQQAETLDSNCIEATVYIAFVKIRNSLLAGNLLGKETAINLFLRTFENCVCTNNAWNLDEFLTLARTLGRDMLEIITIPYEYNKRQKSHGGALATDILQTNTLFVNLAKGFCQILGFARDRMGSAEVSLCIFDFAFKLHQVAKSIYASKLISASETLYLSERKTLNNQFRQTMDGYRQRRTTLLSEMKKYEKDLSDFPSFAETERLKREISNLEEFLKEKKLQGPQKVALKQQITNTKERLVSANTMLRNEKNRQVENMLAELKEINVILGV